jgi:hypothetical protein
MGEVSMCSFKDLKYFNPTATIGAFIMALKPQRYRTRRPGQLESQKVARLNLAMMYIALVDIISCWSETLPRYVVTPKRVNYATLKGPERQIE